MLVNDHINPRLSEKNGKRCIDFQNNVYVGDI